jgi:hypothetical protein
MLQPRDRRVCPLCRSKPTHAPMRVQLLAHSLGRAVAALPTKERQRYNERCAVAGAYQEEVLISEFTAPCMRFLRMSEDDSVTLLHVSDFIG